MNSCDCKNHDHLKTDAFVETVTASVAFDRLMAMQDIEGSVAHATMLSEVGVLTVEESLTIKKGLETIREEIK